MPAKKVLIIGCGYVGTALGESLVRRGFHVVGTTTTREKQSDLEKVGIQARVAEISNTQRLTDLLVDSDVVVLTLGAGRTGDYREVYFEGARSVLAALRHSAVRRIVYTSSTRVYGQTDGSWVDESSPTIPRDERGQLLLDTEQVLLGACESGVSCCVLRLGGIYGPGRELERRVHHLAGTEQFGGDEYVNLIHLYDIVIALESAVTSDFSGVLNLCDDEPEPRRSIYDRLVRSEGLSPIRWVPRSGSDVELGKRVRNKRIKDQLGLQLARPKHDV